MKNLHVTNGFPGMADSYLLVRSKVIHAAMTDNANFQTPSPTLVVVNTGITAFEQAIEAAASGDRQAVAVKKEAREALINLLHLLGNYVLFTSVGNEVVASSSGFRIAKTPTPMPPLSTPQGLLLKNGVNKGELKFSFKRVIGARAYRFEMTPSPITESSVWEASTDTVTKKQYSGLESGKEYNCRVAAYGTKAQVVYSDVVSKFAL